MDRSNGLISRQGSISRVPWPSETSAFTSHLRQCSAESASERHLGFDCTHPAFSSYIFQIPGQDDRDAIRQQQMMYPIQHQMNHTTPGTTAATASRGLASSNWRTIGQDGRSFTRVLPQAQLGTNLAQAAMGHGEERGIATGAGPVSWPSSVNDGYAYYLNRGDGQVTRLIPADVLPSLNEIPPREPEQRGMIVLPLPRGARPSGTADINLAVTVKNQIDRIVATGPNMHKRNKVYCDMWIHEGRCAFTQTGCKFKHEMPLDEESQRALGLFQGLPAWFKKQQEESAMRTALESSSSSSEASPTTSSSRSSEFAWQSVALGRIPGPVDPLAAMSQDNNKLRMFNGDRPVPFSWGPIARPKGPTSFNGPWGKVPGSQT
ncbi:hypothetical protein M441DRAFT_146008 [Trichoderma asperellum CBS 433.97]|uniref:C3H1-type domain-containing protein n=1 Tax=Trichoderma asperellum (strain ATCC 204424 / CBS 433.97 / NBRC 101777) TaxID=1042311 RepID=A0A2T3Z2G7_TRIA4|nr:hypothetical protein M441DRAFT_146008 [Trichoderma asperellum CBS 433.97]PTB38995.1 hypothetical protein M441DRAFT_146008 [Trichoderma asperellum CBS 433.97]